VSDYLRKQAVNGNILQLNEKFYADIMRQISGMATNLNQIARHMNETRTVFQSDVKDLDLLQFNLKLHVDLIEQAVEKLYGNNQYSSNS
jgi:hypothetical protein